MAVPGRGVSRYHRALQGPRWDRVRRQVLDSANWQCALCAEEGKTGYAKEVDHIQPLHLNGAPFAVSNLQAICYIHHRNKTQGENQKPIPGRKEWRQYIQTIMESDIIK